MDGVEEATLVVAKEKAAEEYEVYKAALGNMRTQERAVYADLSRVFYHMKNGRAVIDVHLAIREAGLNRQSLPKIALVRADYDAAFFHRANPGRGYFTGHDGRWLPGPGAGPMRTRRQDVAVPVNTWEDWSSDQLRMDRDWWTSPKPLIPPKLLPNRGTLANYYVLWEVKTWERPEEVRTVPRDPILMKRLSPNVFVVMADWEVSDVEAAVIRGRLA